MSASIYFSRIYKKPVRVEGRKKKQGATSDIVFALSEPLPKAVGVFLDHGWGHPTEFIPMERVRRLDEKGILVQPPPDGRLYSPFEDQPGWILLEKHLMGRTILDIDDRDIEVVNDVLMQEDEGTWTLSAVDASFNGWLRRWGLISLTSLVKDDLIPWKFVQPLSVEDAVQTDRLQLSVTKEQLHDLPKEDLADALEELSGQDQEALFSALEPQKAAETLTEAEPRAQRQLIAHLRQERAQNILATLSTPQLVDLFTVLPHEEVEELLALLPESRQQRVRAMLSESEATATDFMLQEFLTILPSDTVAEARRLIRRSGLDFHGISYLYVVDPVTKALIGVVDARSLLVMEETSRMEEIMSDSVVSAEADDMREDLAAIFAKYHFRMVPVVDQDDHVLGVVRYKDIMKNPGKQ